MTLTMNVNMKAVKNKINVNKKLLFEITTFFFNFLVNLLTKLCHFKCAVKIKTIVL